jgi:putative Ca2+/H+ antiporter (TMEM165/GDT1 family)
MKENWQVFLSTFALVFLAELGDKTQLAAISMAAAHSSRWTVFAGAALALVSITLISIVACELLLRVVPVEMVKRGAGVLFILLGVIILLGK